jgi:hypothetical protein
VFMQAERPYGLTVAPTKGRLEASSPESEQAVARRWTAPLERRVAEVLGIRDVPSEPLRFQLRRIKWSLERMTARAHQVPETVYHRIQALEAAGVPFASFLWGEQQFPKPSFTVEPAPPVERKRDPLIIGVISTDVDRGVRCLLGLWLH